jgi:Flp pilus assembly protein TadD/TolB-like protein
MPPLPPPGEDLDLHREGIQSVTQFMALQPGARLGSFEVLGPLGAGGMGEVYRARDMRLGRDVAIKVLPESFARDPARVARFEREARLLAAINHPAIGAIYGAEEFDSLRCIIMEFVPGETLAERVARGPMPLEEACGLSRQIAEALEAAHEKGVIHRDLKPSNIKVTPEGKVKVLDLGLAKAMEKPSPDKGLSDSPTASLDQTRQGTILGTVGFMSPEQARGKPVDKRADIWAFGCILYEMLSGRRAFTGESAADVVAAILSAEPDWSRLPAATPSRLRELLSRCLQKDLNKRLRDIGDARMEIERALEESRPGSTPLRSARKRWLAAGAVFIGLLAAAAIWLRLRPAPTTLTELPERKQLAVLPFSNLTGDENARLMGVGLVEMVSVRLSGLPGLQVVTPSAVVAAADRNEEVLDTARGLGANVIVLGTFQRQGDKVRITYRVVNVRNGAQIAANTLDGSASDLFSLQDTLADVVARDLHYPGARRRQALSSGLDADQQARYLQAIGLLQRYDRRDSVEQALQLLERLAVERPNSAIVLAALGRANLAMFAFTKERSWGDRAVAVADAARVLDPALPEVDVTLGQTLLATGREKEAVEAFRRALAASPDGFDALLGLGDALEKTGDYKGAEASLRRAIGLQPSSFAAYNHLGAFFFHRGRYPDAATMFGRAARTAPNSYSALNNLGGASTMACDFAAANDAYRKALDLEPANPSATSNLGLNQLWTGQYAEATATLETAVKLGPNDFRVWGNLGDAYRGQGRPDKAAEAYTRALTLAREYLRLNPRDTQAHQIVATSLAMTGHMAEAQEPMRQALALDPKDPDVLANAAIIAALAGRPAEALEWLRKAIDAGYCRAIVLKQPEFSRLLNEPEFRSIVAEPRQKAGS